MFDEKAAQRTFAHVMELWFEPEIRRRQQISGSNEPFPLRAAQAILFSDERKNIIRLNEEVTAELNMKLKDGIMKEPGDLVYEHELEEIPAIYLPKSEDPNCGHFTMILLKGVWRAGFDFRYNKKILGDLISAAEEFFQTAAHALANNRLRAAIDNLFSSAELAAKAYVIGNPTSRQSAIKSHSQVHSRFNLLSKQGLVNNVYRETFNALADARNNARYIRSDEMNTLEEIQKWTESIRDLIRITQSGFT